MENAVETKITIDVDGQEQKLLFTCPVCGSHKLLEENTEAIIRLSVRSLDIESKSTGEVQIADLDYTRDCELLDLAEQSETLYVCDGCPFELRVQNQNELAEWLLNNCYPQARVCRRNN